ncbi:alpha/beta fold hydrolase [Vibrio sp. SCSIO 43137]|uniref:alpha/beta fold hydrolase n=1 Tax=Vibrio sp. SCSIO 43137 TaxID=3021011 RepID=UPI002307631B|nr:alpha/beta hydrolase [Vibrio sp. SCSIO 43137]WCE32183.1 alpha/beta hydrolase [Vibrio sp. SCSIO 43137]
MQHKDYGKKLTIEDYYTEQGSGEPLVLIHGSFATTSSWKRMVEKLSEQYHCICVKLPGHCGTPDPRDFIAPDIETELSLIEQIIVNTTNRPVHIIGHSFGGVVALSLALKQSVPVSKVTLFEPVAVWVLHLMQDREKVAVVDQFLAHYRESAALKKPDCSGMVIDFWAGAGAFAELPDFIRQGMEPLVKNNLRHWQLTLSAGTTKSDIKQCQTPFHIICGTESNPVTRSIAHHLNQQLPDCKTSQIEGASHFLITSHPNECLSLLAQDD